MRLLDVVCVVCIFPSAVTYKRIVPRQRMSYNTPTLPASNCDTSADGTDCGGGDVNINANSNVSRKRKKPGAGMFIVHTILFYGIHAILLYFKFIYPIKHFLSKLLYSITFFLLLFYLSIYNAIYDST